MSGTLLIAGRELGALLRQRMGYVVGAVLLALDGLGFNAIALGGGRRLSAEVLAQFFYLTSGFTMIAALLLSMRMLAQERQAGTIVLLRTAPIDEWQVVLGKYLSGMAFLALFLAATLYMPLLILVNGRIAAGHLAVGYLGLLMLGSASLAVGLLGSALAPNQLLATLLGGALLGALVVVWMLAKVSDPPLSTAFAHLAIWNKHFLPFVRGVLHLRDLVYYLSLTVFFLLAAVRVEQARRWS